jgi:hypothetical protein
VRSAGTRGRCGDRLGRVRLLGVRRMVRAGAQRCGLGSAACCQGASRTGPVTGIRPLGVHEAGVGA